MKKIEAMQFVANNDGETFYKETRSAIDNFQNAGYEIEVQYQATMTHFSALVIGRKIINVQPVVTNSSTFFELKRELEEKR